MRIRSRLFKKKQTKFRSFSKNLKFQKKMKLIKDLAKYSISTKKMVAMIRLTELREILKRYKLSTLRLKKEDKH